MNMKFDIPENCHIRWQAALAVLEDLQEDKKAPFGMRLYGNPNWEKPQCGTVGCFAGWMNAAPYCRELGLEWAGDSPVWLLDAALFGDELFDQLFSYTLRKRGRAKTLAFLKKQLKSIFKESTGKRLIAPLIFYVD